MTLLLPALAAAGVLAVGSSETYATLDDALNDAADGDIVVVTEDQVLTTVIDADVDIVGFGMDSVTLFHDGSTAPMLDVDNQNNVSVRHLTLDVNGTGQRGVLIRSNSKLTLDGVKLRGASPIDDVGSGVLVNAFSSLDLRRSLVCNNENDRQGIVHVSIEGQATAEHNVFAGNTAQRGALRLSGDGSSAFQNTFYANVAEEYGSAISAWRNTDTTFPLGANLYESNVVTAGSRVCAQTRDAEFSSTGSLYFDNTPPDDPATPTDDESTDEPGAVHVLTSSLTNPTAACATATMLDFAPTPGSEAALAGAGALSTIDADGDGWPVEHDCDDGHPSAHPGAPDHPGDGIDQDCNGVEQAYLDADGDGHPGMELAWTTVPWEDGFASPDDGFDCNDDDSAIHPSATESFDDGIDQDCSGGDRCPADLDDDGYLGPGVVESDDLDCDDPTEGRVDDEPNDCDDHDSTRHPGATEVTADGIDQDCNSSEACFTDQDHDGFGTPAITQGDLECTDVGVTPTDDDCDDQDPSIHPDGVEGPADGVDSDCDGQALCYVDGDGDEVVGPMLALSPDVACLAPGFAPQPGADCDDTDATVSPDEVEVCDGVDNDCDSITDEGVEQIWWPDEDEDGHGASDAAGGLVSGCSPPPGYVASNDDCDDDDDDVYPGAPDAPCDGVDSDCDPDAPVEECETGDTGASEDTGESGDSGPSDTGKSGDTGESGDSDHTGGTADSPTEPGDPSDGVLAATDGCGCSTRPRSLPRWFSRR